MKAKSKKTIIMLNKVKSRLLSGKKLSVKIAVASLLICLNVNLSSGQIFLCENDLPNIGDIAILVNADSASGAAANPGPDGAGVTWNFSTSLVPNTRDTTFYIDPVGTPYADSFPQANIAADPTNYPSNGFAYYIKNNNGLGFIGQDFLSSGMQLRFFEPPLYTFPFIAYGDTLNTASRLWWRISPDSVQVSYIVSQNIADAFGTIITPAGSVEALRIYTTQIVYDSLYVNSIGIQNNIITGQYWYQWFAKNLGWPVLEIYKVSWQNYQQASFAEDLSAVPITSPVPTGISGQVTSSLGPVTNGSVAIYGWNDKGTQKNVLVDATTTDAFGIYTFTNVPSGEHLIVARTDFPLNTTATYYGNTFYFDSATAVTALCDSVFLNADITIIEYSPSSTGPGTISGNVRWWDGPGKTGAPVGTPAGDPVEGLDITIEQIPGGTIKGDVITDVLGNYSFTNLDTGTYRIYVDMTGYPIDSFHIITITATDTVFTNKDYWASDSSMYIPSPPLSIFAIENDKDAYIKVFPNPFSDATRLEIIGGGEGEIYSLEIHDITGRIVKLINNISTTIELDKGELTPGLYIYKVMNKDGLIGLGKLLVQ